MTAPGLPMRCPRCRAELRPLDDLVEQARELGGRASQAREALANMRLAIPSGVPAFLVDATVRLPALAAGLACHAGACLPRREP